MPRIRTALIVAITFVIGVCAGAGAVTWAFNEFLFKPQAISSAYAGVSSKVYVLDAIRGGDIEKAKSLLETYLDGDLIVLGAFPEGQLDKHAIAALIRAAQYRDKYPHFSSEPMVASQVSSLLSKYKKSEGAHP